MTDQDIRDCVQALVEAWKTHSMLEAKTSGDVHIRNIGLAEMQGQMERSAVALASEVLVDLHRIADCLEYLAKAAALDIDLKRGRT